MKKLVALAVLGASFSCSSMVMAEGGIYMKGGLCYAIGTDEATNEVDIDGVDTSIGFEADGGTALSIGVGFDVNNVLTTEFSLQYNSGYDVSGDLLLEGQTVGEFTGEDDSAKYSSEVDTTVIMATALIDFAALAEQNWSVRPYAGLGLGYAKNSLGSINMVVVDDGVEVFGGDVSAGGEGSGVAWKAVAGATFPIDKELAIDVSYQYSDYGTVKISDETDELEMDVKSHELMFALRYMF